MDVREPIEWKEDGYVEGAKLIFFADLPGKSGSLPKDKPIAVTCSVGKTQASPQAYWREKASETSATFSAA